MSLICSGCYSAFRSGVARRSVQKARPTKLEAMMLTLVRDNNSLNTTEKTPMQKAPQRERRAILDWRSREVYRIGPS